MRRSGGANEQRSKHCISLDDGGLAGGAGIRLAVDQSRLPELPARLDKPGGDHSEESGGGESWGVLRHSVAGSEASSGITSMYEGSLASRDKEAWVIEKWTEFASSLIEWQDRFVLKQCWQEAETTIRSTITGRSSITCETVDAVYHCWAKQIAKARKRTNFVNTKAFDVGSVSTCMFYPYSMRRMVWVSLGMTFLLVDVFMLTMSVFGLDRLLVLDFVASVYWSFDIFASFRTGIYTHMGLDMNPRSVARMYLKRWFWVDTLTVGYQWAMIVLDARDHAPRSAGFLRYAKVARHVKLIRLAKFDFMMRQVAQRIQSVWVLLLLKMILYLLGVFAWIHVSATFWYGIGTLSEMGWANQMQESPVMPLNYIYSMHWAASQLQGNIDIYPCTPVERAFASCHLVASVVVLSLLVSKLTTVMHALQEARAEKQRLLVAARTYLQQNHISTELSVNVKNYIEQKQAIDAKHSRNRDEHELLQVLPSDLRRALLEQARYPILRRHVLFLAIHLSSTRCFQRLCCDLLQSKTMLPDDSIFCGGVVCLHLYIVIAGRTSYFACSEVMASMRSSMMRNSRLSGRGSFQSIDPTPRAPAHHPTTGAGEGVLERHRRARSTPIQEGAYLCEPAMWVRWIHRGDLDTLSQASLLVLEVPALEELITSYVAAQMSMKKHAARMLHSLNQATSLTDMFSTADVLENEEFM